MEFIELCQEFESLGCKDSTQCAVASKVFLHLQRDKSLERIERCLETESQQLYFKIYPKEMSSEVDKGPVYVLPTMSHDHFDLKMIENLQNRTEREWILLAITDTSSNILLYRFHKDLRDFKPKESYYRQNFLST